MSKIHMETEQVEQTIRQLQRGFAVLEEATHHLKQAGYRLQGAWEGGRTASEFIKKYWKLPNSLESSSSTLHTLQRRLSSELEEWLRVSAHFGEGSSGNTATGSGQVAPSTLDNMRSTVCGGKTGSDKTRCEDIWSHPPGNAEELAYLTMSLPTDQPIAIIQMGDGEYLVLLRGTTGGGDEGSNWGSAFESIFGGSSYQNSVVAALKKANIPDGSTLHFSGHSQGGMVAQNLTVDPRITEYHISTVTMFGSPDTAVMADANVKYVSFEASGDIVPKLDTMATAGVFGAAGMLMTPGLQDVSHNSENHVVKDSEEARSLNQEISHKVYDDPGVLSNEKIPFEAKEWDGVQLSESKVTTLGPNIYKGGILVKDAAGDAIETIGQVAQSSADAVVAAGKAVVDSANAIAKTSHDAVDSVVRSVFGRTPQAF